MEDPAPQVDMMLQILVDELSGVLLALESDLLPLPQPAESEPAAERIPVLG